MSVLKVPSDVPFWIALYEDLESESERGLIGIFYSEDDAISECEGYGNCWVYRCDEELIIQ